MKHIILNIIFLLFFINNAQSQKIIIDSLFQEPISSVDLYSETGFIIGNTNYKGEITKKLISKVSNLNIKYIYFSHNDYEEKFMSKQEFISSKKISLTQRKTTFLDEIVINSKIKKKYLKLTAYFRSIQFNNDEPQYFMDGIVEYVINTKNNKMQINILQNRSLSNKSIKQIDERGLIRVKFNLAGVPNFSDFGDYEDLENDYLIKDNVISNEHNLKIGIIEVENSNVFLNIDIYSEDRPKTMRGFGNISILEKYSVNAVYKENELMNNLKELIYFKEYRKYDIKQKKDKLFTSINVINEIKILSKEFTDEKTKAESDFYYFLNQSNYKEAFWENIDSSLIPPISKKVKIFINNKFYEN